MSIGMMPMSQTQSLVMNPVGANLQQQIAYIQNPTQILNQAMANPFNFYSPFGGGMMDVASSMMGFAGASQMGFSPLSLSSSFSTPFGAPASTSYTTPVANTSSTLEDMIKLITLLLEAVKPQQETGSQDSEADDNKDESGIETFG